MNLMAGTECVKPQTQTQPENYSRSELDHLRGFIQLIKNNEKRTQLVCWGNHSDYNHGY